MKKGCPGEGVTVSKRAIPWKQVLSPNFLAAMSMLYFRKLLAARAVL